jgi:hypothetical protein
MVLLLPNILWLKWLRKYVKCYKQERYYNAELLCEEAVTSRKDFYNAELLCEEVEENNIIVYTF